MTLSLICLQIATFFLLPSLTLISRTLTIVEIAGISLGTSLKTRE